MSVTEVPDELLFSILAKLRTAPIYIDMPQDEDFKEWKWNPYRKQEAEEVFNLFLQLLRVMAEEKEVDIAPIKK